MPSLDAGGEDEQPAQNTYTGAWSSRINQNPVMGFCFTRLCPRILLTIIQDEMAAQPIRTTASQLIHGATIAKTQLIPGAIVPEPLTVRMRNNLDAGQFAADQADAYAQFMVIPNLVSRFIYFSFYFAHLLTKEENLIIH